MDLDEDNIEFTMIEVDIREPKKNPILDLESYTVEEGESVDLTDYDKLTKHMVKIIKDNQDGFR